MLPPREPGRREEPIGPEGDDPIAAARRFAERAKATWWLGELGAAQAR